MGRAITASGLANGLAAVAVMIALSACSQQSTDGLHDQIVALDELGTPGWRTGPGEVESSRLKQERLALAARWFPAGTTPQGAEQVLRAEGYRLLPLQDGFMGGQRSGQWFCRPGTEVHLWVREGAVYQAEVMTYPAYQLLGGTIC